MIQSATNPIDAEGKLCLQADVFLALITGRKQRALCELSEEDRKEYFRKLAQMSHQAVECFIETVEQGRVAS